MNDQLINEDEARARLRTLCEEAGGVGKFADRIGLSVSAVSHQLNGSRPIQGKVAQHMGLKTVRIKELYYREATEDGDV